MKEIFCKTPDLNIINFDSLLEFAEEKHFLEIVKKELASNKDEKVVIWGTYNNAVRLHDYLLSSGVQNIVACVVNEKYLDVSVNQVSPRDDFPLVSLENWLENNSEAVILVDFSFYSPELMDKYRDRNITIYVGDLMGSIILEEPYVITTKMLEDNFDKLRILYDKLDVESQKAYLSFILQKNIGFYNKPYSRFPQYFDRNIVALEENAVLVDCGAYDGDTVNAFKEFTNDRFKSIYSYEMDADNFAKLERNCYDKRVHCLNKGVGEKKATLMACIGKKSASRISDNGTVEIEIVSIDDELYEREHVTFIKMDIEGAELQALKGAEKVIKRDRPILAISLYHKFEDLFEIPAYIRSVNSGYSLFFRNYHNSASECVLYAIDTSIR